MKKKLMIIFLSFALAGELFFSGGANLMVQADEIAVEQETKKESVEQIESDELEANEEQITDETSEDIVILGEKYYVREFNGVKSYFLNPVIRGNEITTQSVTTNEEIIWKYFKAKGFSDAGTAGIMGNLLAESGYDPTNLENASNTKSGLTDAQFTAQVNNGTISRSSFISSTQFSQYSYTDSTGTYYTYGYGLAQWTFYSRKANLYDYWKKSGASSIGDLNMQLDFMYSEMSTSLKNKMISASNVSDACVDFHNIYEGSADTASQIQGRVNNAQNVYNKYHDTVTVPTGIQTIPDGIYHIESKLNLNYGVDVKGGSGNSGVNVQLYKNATDKKQVFKVTYLGNGYYSLISTIGNKCLDVSGGGTTNGTNVQVYNSNNTAAQQWVIKDAGDGYVYIISKVNGLYLDVSSGKVANGTNIQMWTGNGTDAQKWKFVSVATGTKTISDGHYHIISGLDSKYGLDVNQAGKASGTNLQIYQNTKDYLQTFNVKYLNNGLYEITSDISGLSLDVTGGSNVKGTNLQLYNRNNSWAQKWIIKSSGNGYYYIINQGTNLVVDVSNGTIQNKQNVQLWISNGTNAQKWKFVKVSEPKKTTISKITSPAKKKIYVKWGKLTDADGYEIQISKTSKFSSTVCKKKISSTGFTYTKTLKGKRYYVRVRGYKRVGTKYIYGAWSKVKSVKSK